MYLLCETESISPQQSVFTLHLFLCWRAIKYSSRVSSTAEPSFSPWHALLYLNSTRMVIHAQTHTQSRVRKTSISCLKKTDCHTVTQVFIVTHVNHFTWCNLCKRLAPPIIQDSIQRMQFVKPLLRNDSVNSIGLTMFQF